MTCKPSKHASLFSQMNIERISNDVRGVYGFWCRGICLYIGKVESQPLKERLRTHFVKSHNDDLKLWLQTYPKEIRFAYKSISEIEKIHEVERLMIARYAPRTNKTK